MAGNVTDGTEELLSGAVKIAILPNPSVANRLPLESTAIAAPKVERVTDGVEELVIGNVNC